MRGVLESMTLCMVGVGIDGDLLSSLGPGSLGGLSEENVQKVGLSLLDLHEVFCKYEMTTRIFAVIFGYDK